MLIHENSHKRPFDLGPYPLEALGRDPAIIEAEAGQPRRPAPESICPDTPMGEVAEHYRQLFLAQARGEPARQVAPLPDDLARRSTDIRGAAYFLDASHAGICHIPASAVWAGRSKTSSW